MYVRQTFGLDGVYPTATAAWEASQTKHSDRNFPDAWVPVWYGLDNEPAGHVVLRAPNGNVYSTSDLGNTPHLHPDLSDLERYYAYYGMTLTYRGWTEDIETVSVFHSDFGGLAAQGTITTEEPEVAFTAEQETFIIGALSSLVENVATKRDIPTANENKFVQAALVSLVQNVATKADLAGISAAVAAAVGSKASAEEIKAAVQAGMSAGLKVDVSVNGAAK